MASPDILNLNVPAFNIDKLIYTSDDSYSGSGSHGFGVGYSGYIIPIGIYTVDAGVTWRDMSSLLNSLNGDGPGGYRYSSPAGNSRFLTGALMIPGSTGEVTPIFTGTENAYYSKGKYLKIGLFGSFTVLAGSGLLTRTIAHNLGYVPLTRQVFIPQTGGFVLQDVDKTLYKKDTTNLYITVNNAAYDQLFYYIIYED